MAGKVYKIEPNHEQQSIVCCCGNCEYCDVELSKRELAGYAREGSRSWRDSHGNIVKRSDMSRHLICSLYGTATTASETCPGHVPAKTLWK